MKIKKDTKKQLVEYFLTIFFVLFLVGFFTLLITISQYVDKNSNTDLTEHIQTTKQLLENVDEVQKKVENKEQIKIETIDKNIINSKDNLINVMYINLESKNQGILSLVFDKKIEIIENIYYMKYKNITEIQIDDLVVFKKNKRVTYGKYFRGSDGEFGIYMDDKDIEFVTEDEIIGKYILEFNEEILKK